MANPAELLHELLLSWRANGNNNAAQSRKIESKGWASTRRAAQLLNEVTELLRRSREAGHPQPIAEKNVGAWSAMIFAYPHGWNSSGRDNLNGPALDVLGQTSATFRMYVPTFEEKGSGHLDAFLRAVEAKLEGDTSYVAMHAKRVCAHLKKLLADVEAYGEFRIVDALHDLQRILDELADQHPQDPFWKRAATATWSWFKSDVMLPAISGATAAALTAGAINGAEIVTEFVQGEISAGENHDGDSPDESSRTESPE